MDIRHAAFHIAYSLGLGAAVQPLDHLWLDVDGDHLARGPHSPGGCDGVPSAARTDLKDLHARLDAVAAGHIVRRLDAPPQRVIDERGHEFGHREFMHPPHDAEHDLEDDEQQRNGSE
jgi:hypothetical protein